MDRPAAFAGLSYPADPHRLRRWIGEQVEVGAARALPGPWRAVLAPHLDPARGGPVYGSAYAALREHPARRFVILGVAHEAGRRPATGTIEDTITPLGRCPTDRPFIRRLAQSLPFDLFEESRLHRGEHSVEHQAIFLRALFDDWGRRRLVPLLLSPPPRGKPARERRRFESERGILIGELRALIDEETAVVVAADFAHIGIPFGDPPGRAASAGEEMRRLDAEMMAVLASGAPEEVRRRLRREEEERRVCGAPALEALADLLPGGSGTVLDYGQAFDRAADALVTYGAMVFP